MAIVKCPECSGNVSELAITCPHCGYPLSDDSMSTRISIPAIPKELWDGLRKAATSNNFLNWKVKVGDWVKEGDILAIYNVRNFEGKYFTGKVSILNASILAPISGKVSTIKNIQYSEWDWKNLKSSESTWYFPEKSTENLTDQNIILTIDTPNTSNNIYRESAYKVYRNLVDYGYFAKARADRFNFIGFYFGSSIFEESDFPVKYLEGLANSELRIDKLK